MTDHVGKATTMTDHIGEATKKVIDLDALEKRLKRTKWTRERNDGPNGNYFDEVCDEDDFGAEESLVNPDGPEAIATIKALVAELKEAKKRVSRPEGEYRWKHIAQRAEALIDEASAIILGLAVELEGEVEGRYAEVKDHPAMARRYERDMDAVIHARAFLARNGKGEGK